jgi:hypothetical protein
MWLIPSMARFAHLLALRYDAIRSRHVQASHTRAAISTAGH